MPGEKVGGGFQGTVRRGHRSAAVGALVGDEGVVGEGAGDGDGRAVGHGSVCLGCHHPAAMAGALDMDWADTLNSSSMDKPGGTARGRG